MISGSNKGVLHTDKMIINLTNKFFTLKCNTVLDSILYTVMYEVISVIFAPFFSIVISFFIFGQSPTARNDEEMDHR